MKKKGISLCLAAVLMMGSLAGSVSAAATGPAKELSLDNIYKVAKANNPTIHANDYTASLMWDMVDIETPTTPEYILTMIANLKASEEQETREIGLVLESLFQQQYGMLASMTASSSSTTAAQVNKLENASKQIAYGAVTMLLNYYSLEGQLTTMRNNQKAMERQKPVSQKMVELGMMSQMEYDNFLQSMAELENGVATLENGLTALKGQIAAFCNYKPEQITIAPLTVTDRSKIAEMETKVNSLTYGEARKNSGDIEIQEDAVSDSSGDQKRIEEITLTNMLNTHRLAFDTMKNDCTVGLSKMRKAYSDYDLAQTQFVVQQKQYELGMLSQLEYESAKDGLVNAEVSLRDADITLETAYRKFIAFVEEGVWSQSN